MCVAKCLRDDVSTTPNNCVNSQVVGFLWQDGSISSPKVLFAYGAPGYSLAFVAFVEEDASTVRVVRHERQLSSWSENFEAMPPLLFGTILLSSILAPLAGILGVATLLYEIFKVCGLCRRIDNGESSFSSLVLLVGRASVRLSRNFAVTFGSSARFLLARRSCAPKRACAVSPLRTAAALRTVVFPQMRLPAPLRRRPRTHVVARWLCFDAVCSPSERDRRSVQGTTPSRSQRTHRHSHLSSRRPSCSWITFTAVLRLSRLSRFVMPLFHQIRQLICDSSIVLVSHAVHKFLSKTGQSDEAQSATASASAPGGDSGAVSGAMPLADFRAEYLAFCTRCAGGAWLSTRDGAHLILPHAITQGTDYSQTIFTALKARRYWQCVVFS